MTTSFKTLSLASAIAFALGALPHAAQAEQTVKQDLREARIEGQILGSYALNRHLNPFDFDVELNGETVILTGTVDEAIDKELAEQVALGIDGVKNVDNKIVVDAAYQPPKRSTSKPSFKQSVEDATVTASVKSKLLWNEHTDGLDIKVRTVGGVVTLTGTADTAASKDLAARLASNTDGVRNVDNRLIVGAGPTEKAKSEGKDAVETAETVVSDSWITTKVKSTLMFSSNVDGTDITVETDKGVVTLTGQVDSSAEKDLAIELADNVRGVKSVKATGLKNRG